MYWPDEAKGNKLTLTPMGKIREDGTYELVTKNKKGARRRLQGYGHRAGGSRQHQPRGGEEPGAAQVQHQGKDAPDEGSRRRRRGRDL